jgi:hypothetical protein
VGDEPGELGKAILFIGRLLHVFAFVRRHVPRSALRAIVVARGRPHVGPLVGATGTSIEVSELHGGLLYEAGEHRRRFHRVAVALLAVAGVLVGLHLASEVAIFTHANGRADGIPEHRFHQLFGAVVAFDFNELGELRLAKCINIHVLLLATDARDIRAAGREGELI